MEHSVRLTAALLLVCTLCARADGLADIDLTEPGARPIVNVPVQIGEQTAIVSFTPRQEPTTFVIDASNFTVTERKGFVGERKTHSLVIEQGNVRILILRDGGRDL
jgi:hypothetical protein